MTDAPTSRFGTTPDPALASQLSLSYAQPFLIDGQGFLVNKDVPASATSRALAGKRICFVEGSPEGVTLKTAMSRARHRRSPRSRSRSAAR